jgi:ABC-type molybdenum transport system ATPase subunit/photorepair protein PhrA
MENPLVKIHNAVVYLNGYKVLTSIDWTMQGNENWAIVGNNGAGKTTFMKLVFGELIPVHGGYVRWFGQPELTPMDQIRPKIGFVSAEYQENYRYNILGWEVVASGLLSSIGIYEKISQTQKQTALEWMDFLGIERLAKTGFRKMSYG